MWQRDERRNNKKTFSNYNYVTRNYIAFNIKIVMEDKLMLKEYRKLRCLTFEQVAEKCNISWRNLLRIENGAYKKAKFETIIKLIEILEISDEDILKLIKN